VVLDNGQSATASSEGAWSFELAPGSYTATATATGYTAGSSTATVVAGQDVWASIGLTASSTPTPDAGATDTLLADGSADGEPGVVDGGESDLGGGRAGDERPTEGCGSCGVTPGAPGLAPWLLLLLVWRQRR